MIPLRLRPILLVGRGNCGTCFAQYRVGSLRKARSPYPATYHTTASKSHKGANLSSILLATTCGFLCFVSAHKIFTDSDPSPVNRTLPPVSNKSLTEQKGLFTIVWGSNRARIISPSTAGDVHFRVPSIADYFQDVALRDLAAHERHAACVDAAGNVYQWGDGFFDGSGDSEMKPALTLQGKDITHVQLSASKLFALSATGQVYVLSTDSAKQRLTPDRATTANSWWGISWLLGNQTANQIADFAEIKPNVSLVWGERFVSISAGDDHLLALTSKGRTFVHPISRNANTHGQLGLHKIHVMLPGLPLDTARVEVDLIPKVVKDPHALSAPAIRDRRQTNQQNVSPEDSTLSAINDSDIRFCDTLFEMPSLTGVTIAQVVAGARTSFARTGNGRVLGWGANEHRQLGLGNRVRLDSVFVPTEITFGQKDVCLGIYAGDDLTCFAIERKNETLPATVDLLFCGDGQWGGLGNNTFSNAQGDPVRARAISGLLEYNERSKSMEAVHPHSISISPVGHVLVTLDTLLRSSEGTGGRDLFVWGNNYEYQLGMGKRGSVPVPTSLENPDGSRFMLSLKKAEVVKDLQGRVWKRGVYVEQRAVALHGSSLVYWRTIR